MWRQGVKKLVYKNEVNQIQTLFDQMKTSPPKDTELDAFKMNKENSTNGKGVLAGCAVITVTIITMIVLLTIWLVQ